MGIYKIYFQDFHSLLIVVTVLITRTNNLIDSLTTERRINVTEENKPRRII